MKDKKVYPIGKPEVEIKEIAEDKDFPVIYKINKDIGIFANQFVDFSLKLYFSSDITETDKKDMILCVKYIDNFKYLISELYNKNDVGTKNLLYENMLTWHDGIDDDDDN